MAKDIDVDEEQLHRFIEALAAFQQVTTEKLQSVETSWNQCEQTWKGASKNQLTTEFVQTKQAIESALAAGDDAQKWLERFNEIVREFERY